MRNREIATEPLGVISDNDPASCEIYVNQQNLIDTSGWKNLRHISNIQKKLFRMVNQTRLKSFRLISKYTYGFMVLMNYTHDKQLDGPNKNTKWQESTNFELSQLDEYDIFISHGIVRQHLMDTNQLVFILFMIWKMIVDIRQVVLQMVIW